MLVSTHSLQELKIDYWHGVEPVLSRVQEGACGVTLAQVVEVLRGEVEAA